MLLAAAFVAAGCSKENNGGNSGSTTPVEELKELAIGIHPSDTKASFGKESEGKMDFVWSTGDEVCVKGAAGESIFRLKSGAGSTSGVFEYKSGAKNHKVVTDVIYPASRALSIPAAQTYKAGTFDASALTLAYHNPSAKDNSDIMLRNESSILCFQLKGTDKLNSIKVAIKGGKTYTLSTPSVQLSSTATPFYIVVPAQKAEKVTVVFASASGAMSTTLSSPTFTAGTIHKFAPLTYKADKMYRIMSYNIGQCNQGGNSSARLIADVTKELGADVAVMNEVRAIPSDYSKIANALGWEYYFKKAIFTMGNMITYNPSKLKKLGEDHLQLKNVKNEMTYNENRICLFMEFEDFILLGSHLEKDDFPIHTQLITDKVKAEYAKKGKPVIFCGDMNTRPYAEEMKAFTKEWEIISRADMSTFYNPDQPNNLICIDYIFLWKGGPEVGVVKADICKSVNCCKITDASDHFPIYVDVTIGNKATSLKTLENPHRHEADENGDSHVDGLSDEKAPLILGQ